MTQDTNDRENREVGELVKIKRSLDHLVYAMATGRTLDGQASSDADRLAGARLIAREIDALTDRYAQGRADVLAEVRAFGMSANVPAFIADSIERRGPQNLVAEEIEKWREMYGIAYRDRQEAERELEVAEAQLGRAKEALTNVIGCFEAARAEGLTEQLAQYEAEPGNLVDLVMRRLCWAETYALAALETDTPEPIAEPARRKEE